jgi:hypothetical protein
MAVYFIQTAGENAIKIGYAKEPQKRRAELQTGHHEELTVVAVIARGDMALERRLHDRFAKSHIRGEWFRPTEELLGFIEGVRACEDVPPAEPPAKTVVPLTVEHVRFLIDVALWRAEFERINIDDPDIRRFLLQYAPAAILDRGGPASPIETHQYIAQTAIQRVMDVGITNPAEIASTLDFSSALDSLDEFYASVIAEGHREMDLLAKGEPSSVASIRATALNKCIWCHALDPRYLTGMFGWGKGDFNCHFALVCAQCATGIDRPHPYQYRIDLEGTDAPVLPTKPLFAAPVGDGAVCPWLKK